MRRLERSFPERGRIGVAALDLATGRTVSVLGDQPFPMASTSKIAVVATFLDGVDQGRWKLTDQFPTMVPVSSARLSANPARLVPGERPMFYMEIPPMRLPQPRP